MIIATAPAASALAANSQPSRALAKLEMKPPLGESTLQSSFVSHSSVVVVVEPLVDVVVVVLDAGAEVVVWGVSRSCQRSLGGITASGGAITAATMTGTAGGTVNLNDGTGPNSIQGGVMDGLSLGLNWYMNTNLSVNFDWSYDNRYDLPAGSAPGHTNGFGSRVQFQF